MLLIDLLRKIETRLSTSFCDMVYSWEITTSSPLATAFAAEADSSNDSAPGSKKKRKIDELSDMLLGESSNDGLNGVTPLFVLGKGVLRLLLIQD